MLCEWTDPVDGKVYVFVSPNLWFDPTDLIARRNITSFPVQIDSEDPSYYYVDISCLQITPTNNAADAINSISV